MYLINHISVTGFDIAELLGVKSTRARKFLPELVEERIIETEGGNRNRIYKLKS